MSDNLDGKTMTHRTKAPAVDALATRALSVAAARRGAGHATHRAAHLRDMFDASIEARSGSVRGVVREILRLGVSTETLTDIYIPEVARRLGAAWLADRLTFVEVTIGTARLQSIARDLALGPDPREGAIARIAVVVPWEEDHTLGAIVLIGQLRRMGVAVASHMGEPDDQVARSLGGERPDAVLISSGHIDGVAPVARLVRSLREMLGDRVPVVVGGPILEVDDVDVLAETEADAACSDPAEALALCRSGSSRASAELVRERVR